MGYVVLYVCHDGSSNPIVNVYFYFYFFPFGISTTVPSMCAAFQDRLERGVASEGSNLSGVSARCAWESCEKLETEQGRTSVDVDDSSPKPRRLSSSGK